MIVALSISMLLARKIIRPINTLIKLTRNAKQRELVSLGNPPEKTPSEIRTLWQAFSELLDGLQRSNAEVKRLNLSLQADIEAATAELREMNTHLYLTSTQDYLTSLSNRRHFTQFLDDVLAQKSGKRIGIIIIDIDKFKGINDHYGHEVGDTALQKLSGILRQTVRPCDLAARLGGDEFIVYVENASDDTLAQIAENIRQYMESSPLALATSQLRLTLSIGTVNAINDGTLSLKTLLRHADQAMYHSKTTGRNKVSTYQSLTTTNQPPQAAKPL